MLCYNLLFLSLQDKFNSLMLVSLSQWHVIKQCPFFVTFGSEISHRTDQVSRDTVSILFTGMTDISPFKVN